MRLTHPGGIMLMLLTSWKNASWQGGGTSMPVEENMALARRFLTARFKGDLDAMDEMMAPDFVSHTPLLPGEVPSREGYKRRVAEYSAAFSHVRFVIEDQVAADDKVATRFIVHFTHDLGELMG